MFSLIYNSIYYTVITFLLIFVLAMFLRLIFNYADPNPFSKIGRLGWWLKTKTDSFVRPFADFLAIWRIDTRLAPLLTLLVGCVLAWIGLTFVFNILFTINGIVGSLGVGSVQSAVGYLLGGLLSLYGFCIFLRILSVWILSYNSKIRQFLGKICDPILVPFQKLLPPFQGFDFSPLLVMLLISIVQGIVMKIFIKTYIPF